MTRKGTTTFEWPPCSQALLSKTATTTWVSRQLRWLDPAGDTTRLLPGGSRRQLLINLWFGLKMWLAFW